MSRRALRMASRGHAAYGAFLVHRISGIALSLFIPLHFWALSRGIRDAAALDALLRWSDRPLVKAAEIGLVVLLAAHLAGGLRVLVLELLPWRDGRKDLIALGVGASLVLGLAFWLNGL